MKIILVVVTSLDGKTTKWNLPNVHDLSSKEDQEYFFNTLNKSKLLIMGRRTFEVAKPDIYEGPKKLRVVITNNPKKYLALEVPDRLMFTNKNPKEIIRLFEKQGFKQALLLGGSEINALFLKAKLVDEIWLTIEPRIFGSGKVLAEGDNLDIKLKLLSFEKMNSQGTLLLKYIVV